MAAIHGTTADTDGKITMEGGVEEAVAVLSGFHGGTGRLER
jgi:hypothetical protein